MASVPRASQLDEVTSPVLPVGFQRGISLTDQVKEIKKWRTRVFHQLQDSREVAQSQSTIPIEYRRDTGPPYQLVPESVSPNNLDN